MLTKRMMLGAGALALALAVAACSEDRAGGATGVSELTTSAARTPPPSAPAQVAVPPENGGKQPPVGSDGAVHFSANGHQYVIQVLPGPDGGDVTRIVQDGAILLEAQGTPASLSTATEASVTLFFEGQVLYSDLISLQGTALATIPEQFLAVPGPASGPQLQAAMPCVTELSLFGSASAWLSLELFLARNGAGSWARLRSAASAVVATGAALFTCLAAHW